MKPYYAIIALSLLGLNAQAEVNKWVDSEGKVHYSDTRPPEASAQTVRNLSDKGQPEAPASYSTKSYVEREAELKKARVEKDETEKKKAQQEADTEARKRNCEAARQNARALEQGTRIVTYGESGEPIYLDDEARAQRLEEANKAVGTYCN